MTPPMVSADHIDGGIDSFADAHSDNGSDRYLCRIESSMASAGKIIDVLPKFALPGGEIEFTMKRLRSAD